MYSVVYIRVSFFSLPKSSERAPFKVRRYNWPGQSRFDSRPSGPFLQRCKKKCQRQRWREKTRAKDTGRRNRYYFFSVAFDFYFLFSLFFPSLPFGPRSNLPGRRARLVPQYSTSWPSYNLIQVHRTLCGLRALDGDQLGFQQWRPTDRRKEKVHKVVGERGPVI